LTVPKAQDISGQIEPLSQRALPSRRQFVRSLSSLLLAISVLVAARPAKAQVPVAVGTSQAVLTPSGNFDNGAAVADSCGNAYVMQLGGQSQALIQIAAGTLTQTVLSPGASYYNQGTGLAIDPRGTFLYYPYRDGTTTQWYSNQWTVATISNCGITGTATFPANSISGLFNGYFGTASALAVDKLGSVYFVPSSTSNGNIGVVTCDTAPSTACTAPPTGKIASVALNNWQGDGGSSTITSLAVDNAFNLYFTDQAATKLYKLASPYTGTPVAVATFNKAVGVTADPQGDLYIADAGVSIVYEVPNEASGLNFSDKFEVVANLSLTNQVGVDANQNIYLAPYPNVLKLTRNNVPFAGTNLGSNSSSTINYVFNDPAAVATINFNTGTATSSAFSNTGGGCTAKSYAIGDTCSVTAKFTPTLPGLATGALVFADASGNALNTAAISGVGYAPALTIDPGTLTSLTATLTAPKGDFVDAQGNLFVADSGANAVIEFAAGSTTGTAISTGSLTLKGPTGVAVDGTGNVFIADTGNNQIVEVPVVQGALAPASAAALAISASGVTLSSPGGLAVDATGNLYIADTGNSRIVVVPNLSGTLGVASASAYGVGLNKPLGVAVDLNGNVFVADTGNNDVIEIAAPVAGNTHQKVVTGLNGPSAIATDASGSLYVVDAGNASVVKYPVISGVVGSPLFVGGAVAAPYGVAIDVSGNLYVTDSTNAAVDQINRVQATLPFGVTNVGQTSLSQSATLGSSGTASLAFASPDYTVSGSTTAGFKVTSDTCPTSGNIVPGSSCVIKATLTPPNTELDASQTLAFSSNAVGGAASLTLIGTGAELNPSTVTLSLTSPASGTLAAGTAATFTAVIGTGSSTIVPTGTVTFFNNGSQYGAKVPITLVNGAYQAQVTFANGLPAGTNTVSANYSGDTLNYTASQGSVQVTVVGLANTLALTAVTPFTNPQSAGDNPANPTGPSIKLTAVLTVPSAIIPTGTVSFYSGSAANPTLVGIGNLTALNGVYQAQVTETALRSTAATGTVGENGSIITNYSLFAAYSGDTTYNPSSSNSLPIVITGAPATQNICATAPTMTITATALAGGVATYSYTASTAPAVGQIITVLGTKNGSGVFNAVGVTIASVTGTTTGTFTVAGFTSGSTVASASDTGTASALCAPNTTGATFTITPANPSLTVTSTSQPGQGSGTTALTINSYGGWQGVITFTCSNLPAFATCDQYPGAPTVLYTNGPTPVQFIINTNVPPVVANANSLLWYIAGVSGFALLLARRRLARLGLQRLSILSGLLLLLGASLGTTIGCGSGSQADITPAGTTNVLVTVTAAQGIAGTTNQQARDANTGSFTIALTVK
jgi:sugar lactone lactonase YvrE